MGLWLKCPHCQTANPLDFKSCETCNASLEKLPAAKRVYILAKAPPPASQEASPKAAAEKASTESPPKRAKGAKSRKKKQ
jgi:hypothetical protein